MENTIISGYKMPDNFDLNPLDIFNDRMGQWMASGIPTDILLKAKSNIKTMWTQGSGGWNFEFSLLAQDAEIQKQYLIASLLYGLAKYPCLVNSLSRRAYQHQLANYLQASKTFPFQFERRVALVPYRGITTPVTYHVMFASNPKKSPVIIRSGGIDTYKMDTHASAADLAKKLDVNVVLIDIPGTGESQVQLAPDNDEIYRGIINEIRPLGNGKVAYFAYSFGAYWAVRLAFENAIDAAIAVGAPLSDAFLRKNGSQTVLQKALGMNGVFSVAFGFDTIPDDDVLWEKLEPFSLEKLGLISNIKSVPLFLVNGSDDPYIPNSDVSRFENISNIKTWLVSDSGHCASRKSKEISPVLGQWMKEILF